MSYVLIVSSQFVIHTIDLSKMYATFWGGVVIKESRLRGAFTLWSYRCLTNAFTHTLSTHPLLYHFTCIVSCKCNGVCITLCLALT